MGNKKCGGAFLRFPFFRSQFLLLLLLLHLDELREPVVHLPHCLVLCQPHSLLIRDVVEAVGRLRVLASRTTDLKKT